MTLYHLRDLPLVREGHIFGGVADGKFISAGAMLYQPPGRIAHADEPRHIHDSEEVFVILQGKAVVHFDKRDVPLAAGEVMVVEPGENHHLKADRDDPPVMLYLHFGPKRHPDQRR